MPFFTRKTGKKEKPAPATAKNNSGSGHAPYDENFGDGFGGGVRPKTLLLKSVSLQDIERGDLGGGPSDMEMRTPILTCSRLSKTLCEILHDRDALPYFIQFMEFRDGSSYVRFWLDAESFQASSLTRARSRSRSQLSLGKTTLPDATTNKDLTKDVQVTSHLHSQSHSNKDGQVGVISVNDLVPSDESAKMSFSTSCDKPKGLSDGKTESPSTSNSIITVNNSNKESHCDIERVDSHEKEGTLSNGENNNHYNKSGIENQVSSQYSLSTSSNIEHSLSTAVLCSTGSSNNSAHGGSGCPQNVSSTSTGRIISGNCDASNTNTHIAATVCGGSFGTCVEKNAVSSSSSNTGACEVNVGDKTGNIKTASHHGNNSTHISSPLSSGQKETVTNNSQNRSNVHNSSSKSSTISSNVRLPDHNDVENVVVGCDMPEGATSSSVDVRMKENARKSSTQAIEDKLLKSIAKDAVSIFSKYIAKDATHPIGVTDELRAETIRKICREDGLVDPQSFEPCQEFVVHVMNERYHSDFLMSEYHMKHEIDILTGSKVYLADILYNDNAFSYFMQYMEQEGAMPLLQCWMELDNFQQLLVDRQGKYDPMEAQNDAMIIYDKYFSLQATKPLGYTDSVRFEVEANICREEGPLPDCFAKAKKIVVHTLDREYFSFFLKSAIFYKYLQDLINSVQLADIPSVQKKRKNTDTDSGSEHSAGSHSTTHSEGVSGRNTNTLLATGVSKALSKMEDNMQIDNDLLNPDKLWKRSQAGNMSLGRIDELGNFVSELDTELVDSNRGGFFNKKSREKEKTQEEMAAQIAQMIIKDCSLPQ